MMLERPSTSRGNSSFNNDFSDCDSDVSMTASTVILTSSCDDLSDKSLDELPSTQQNSPLVTKAAVKYIHDKDRPKELPPGFCLPTKYGKVTDENLKSGNISEVDRAKVIKTVATCVLVYTFTIPTVLRMASQAIDF